MIYKNIQKIWVSKIFYKLKLLFSKDAFIMAVNKCIMLQKISVLNN